MSSASNRQPPLGPPILSDIDLSYANIAQILDVPTITNSLLNNISVSERIIRNVADPVLSHDAANKEYVDTHSSSAGGTTGQIQYNDNGVFGGITNWTTDGVNTLVGQGSTSSLAVGGSLTVDQSLTVGQSINVLKVTGITTPIINVDAANKFYVDNAITTNPGNVPPGGLANEVLTKVSSVNFDTTWASAQATSGVPLGGAAGTFLIKASGADLDTEWYPDFLVNTNGGLDLTQNASIPNATVSLSSNTVNATATTDIGPNTLNRVNTTFNLQPAFDFYDIYNTNDYMGLNATFFNNIIDKNTYVYVDPTASCSNVTTYTSTTQINGSVSNSVNGFAISEQLTSTGSMINGNMNGFQYFPSVNSAATANNLNISGYSINTDLGRPVQNLTGYNTFLGGTSCPVNYGGFSVFSNATGTINNLQGLVVNTNQDTEITNFTGVNIFAQNITDNFNGLSVSSSITNPLLSLNGLLINPQILDVNNANGIFIDTSNTIAHVGTVSTLVIQDLTYVTQIHTGPNSGIFVQYVNSPSASPPVPDVSVGSNTVIVTFSTGASTASDIKSAVDAFFAASALVEVYITGTGSNPQTSPTGPSELTGGSNDGTVRAGYFNGDVHIDGDLSFTGSLSIGQLNSFYSQDLQDSISPGQPTSIDTLITGVVARFAHGPYTAADTLGINTACLMQFEPSTSVSTTFIGIAALGLPAVVSMGTGSTVDTISGALFALSLDGSAPGGHIDNVNLCRALAIPNGVTTVDNLKGFNFQLPFGSIGTTEWGLYVEPTCSNFIKGSLNIGGVVGSTDRVSDVSIGLEITDKHVRSRQTTAPTISNGSLTAATDIKGSITMTDTGLVGLQTTVTFNVAYTVAPVVVLTPKNAVAGVNAIGYYVTSTTADFSVYASSAGASESYEYYYLTFG